MAALGGPSTPTTYSYDPVGNLSNYTYPNTVQTANVFDTLNRLTQTCSATSSPACSASSKLSSYSYTLGNAGNRTNVLELNSRNVAYGYDNDYRLQSEAITADPAGKNGTVNYVYDVVGNRASMTSTLNAVPGGSFFFDANDRLTTDTYDGNGNTTSSASIVNKYDFENRMTQHGGLLLAYDGDGNRASETIGGTTTKFLVDDHNPTHLPQVLDELISGSVTRTYAYGLQRLSENQLISGNWTPSFYGYDGHDNVRFLVNSAGTVTDSFDYDAFGMPIRTSGTTPNQFLYSAERSDSSVGLYDLRARYYDQATGRFWARDPEEGYTRLPRTLHPYMYAWDDPANRIDPTGRDSAEYTLSLNRVSLRTILGQIALATALACATEEDATGFGSIFYNLLNGSNPLNLQQAGPCAVKPGPTCKTEYPDLIPVKRLPWFYEFPNEDAAFYALSDIYAPRQIRKTTDAMATGGPCPVGGQYKPGWHINTNFVKGGGYAGALVGCPCCDDSSGEPQPTERWGIIPELDVQ